MPPPAAASRLVRGGGRGGAGAAPGEPTAAAGRRALRAGGADLAGRIAAKTGARLTPRAPSPASSAAPAWCRSSACPIRWTRRSRGSPGSDIILVGAKRRSLLRLSGQAEHASRRPAAQVHVLARPQEDLLGALEALGRRGGRAVDPGAGRASCRRRGAAARSPPRPRRVDRRAVAGERDRGRRVGDHRPRASSADARGPPHDWLANTGGSIGMGMPVAIGAAIACPDRKVVSLEGDGSGMYTLQALWTMAREGLEVTTVLFANRTYNILKGELAKVGAGNPGRSALDMLEIGRPDLDWVAMARGMGVPAARVNDDGGVQPPPRRGYRGAGPLSGRSCAVSGIPEMKCVLRDSRFAASLPGHGVAVKGRSRLAGRRSAALEGDAAAKHHRQAMSDDASHVTGAVEVQSDPTARGLLCAPFATSTMTHRRDRAAPLRAGGRGVCRHGIRHASRVSLASGACRRRKLSPRRWRTFTRPRRSGLDVTGLAELHFDPQRSVLSAPLRIASAIAGATRRIEDRHCGSGIARRCDAAAPGRGSRHGRPDQPRPPDLRRRPQPGGDASGRSPL